MLLAVSGREHDHALMLVLLLVLFVGGGRLAAQGVEARGMSSEIKLEEVVFGHLAEINGKFRRASH